MSTAGIILIGDEILSGKVRDENAHFLIGELRQLGVSLQKIVTIPDVLEEIAVTVRELAGRFDHVFTSGGVGPTHDDLTMAGVALAFGRVVVRHPELEALLRGYYGARLQERNLRMADVPEGAHFVHGDATPSWPVVALDNVYILPGIPELFRKKFESMKERFRDRPFHLKQLFTTLEEGHIAHELDRVVAAYAAVQIGSYPTFSSAEYKVKVTIEGKDGDAVARACDELVRALGAAIVRVE
jgi:molybdenum cofactor synthesis domain-containing protein